MEYRIVLRWRVFIYIVTPLMSALGVWLLFEFFSTYKINNDGLALEALILLIPICLIAGSLYSLIRIHKEKIVSRNGKFVHHLVFSEKELGYEQVKGFRINENYIYLVPKQKVLKTIRLSVYIEKKESFINNLYDRFIDLDTEDKTKEASEILSNIDFGKDELERKKRFSLAKKTTNWLTAISLIACLWAWFYPKPYSLVILTNILLPVIAIIALINFKGLIKIDSHQNSTYPSIILILIFSVAAIGARCLFDYNFLDLSNVWSFSTVISICVYILLWFSTGELKKTNLSGIFSSLVIFLIVFAHLLSSTALLNVMLDSSSVSVYKAEVFSKHSSKNFDSVKLSDGWKSIINKRVTANISSSFFNRVQEGDSVLVTVREGALNSSWFIVEEVIFSTITDSLENFEFKEDSTLYKLNKL